MRRASITCVLLLALLLAGRQSSGVPATSPVRPLGLDIYMPMPDANPLTPEKVALGRSLFFEPLLSRDRSVACASCHQPHLAFTDGRAVSAGVFGRRGTRNAPTLVNRGYGLAHFWDGRSSTLEEQVLHPIQDKAEMDLGLQEAVARLARVRHYRIAFRDVFGSEVNEQDLAFALASYLRTIMSGDARFDRYQEGDDDALTAEEKRGLALFRGKANCTACHLGPLLSDERFHNTGVAWQNGAYADIGRFAVSGRVEHRGAFKTPTLREVERTPPYMHDGSLATLEDVIAFYDRGGRPNAHLDPEIRPLGLSPQDKQALAAFLRSLNGSLLEAGHSWKREEGQSRRRPRAAER